MNDPEWLAAVVAARALVPPPIPGRVYLGEVGVGVTGAQRIEGQDRTTYIVKFQGNPDGTRVLATEQVIAVLGQYLAAPIPPVVHMDIDSTIAAAARAKNGHAAAGIHHGSREESEVGSREGPNYIDDVGNRERFGALLVLYSCVKADDQQFIYKKTDPHLVFSVDHARFLPGSMNWSRASLDGSGPPTVDPTLAAIGLTSADADAPITRLDVVSADVIAGAVARIHASWGVSDDDQIALARFIERRAAETVQLLRSVLP